MKNILNWLRRSGNESNTIDKNDWRSVTSMLKPNEREHLFIAASERYLGKGAIVDLGTWLGGSTAALASGLFVNKNEEAQNHSVHAFDRFEMTPFIKKAYAIPELSKVPVGGSFLSAFQENIEPWASRIKAYPGDLTQQKWNAGPIELMHVDIMKNWELTNSVLANFFVHLIPGRTMVLHQDFVHYNTVWIHLVMHRLREYFEPIGHVPGTTTYEFLSTKSIPEDVLTHSYSFKDFSDTEVNEAFDLSVSLIKDPFMVLNIHAARAMTYVYQDRNEEALGIMEPWFKVEEELRSADPSLAQRRSELWKVKERIKAAK